MRQLRSHQHHVVHVQDALDEFSERMEEQGIQESDVISVAIMPATSDAPKWVTKGMVRVKPNYEVAIAYWSNESPRPAEVASRESISS
jgi:hypothetical protein